MGAGDVGPLLDRVDGASLGSYGYGGDRQCRTGAAAQRHHRLLRRPGYGDLGCYGSRAIATPNVDRLAREGVRMTDYYACNAICAPSRAELLTGRYPFRSGVIGNLYPKDEPFTRRAAREYVGGSLQGLALSICRKGRWWPESPPRELLLGEALQTAGYRTAMVGKWHLGDYSIDAAYNPRRNGFDFYLCAPQQRYAALPPVPQRGDAASEYRHRSGQIDRPLHPGSRALHQGGRPGALLPVCGPHLSPSTPVCFGAICRSIQGRQIRTRWRKSTGVWAKS